MRPNATELITYLDDAFNERILPLLTDPFVRNRANVLNQIIGALYQRWRFEGQMLWADNADLRQLLSVAGSEGIDVGQALQRADAAAPPPHEYPTVERLTEQNNLLKRGLEQVIAALPLEVDDNLRDLERALHAYLRRQLDRELQICAAPVFGEGEGIGRRPNLPRA
jgi:hypothetical protein